MDIATLNQKILRRTVGALELGAYPCIGRLECLVRQSWPVSSDSGIEGVGSCWIDIIIQVVHPLDIGSEAGLPAKVQSKVNTKPRCFRDGIDEVGEGGPT